MVWKIKPMASGALTISEGLKGKTRKGRKVVLGVLCLQSIDSKVVTKNWTFHGSREGQAENLCTSPKQLFSQLLSVSGERLAKGRIPAPQLTRCTTVQVQLPHPNMTGMKMN